MIAEVGVKSGSQTGDIRQQTGTGWGEYGDPRPTGPHTAIHILAPQGTHIVSAAGGTVVRAADLGPPSGKAVISDHGGGVVTSYSHHSDIDVQDGEAVTEGQVIAFHVLAEGKWRNWRSWPSPAGKWILLTYEEEGVGRRFDLVDASRRIVRPLAEAAHRALGVGVPVDAQWAADGSTVAVDLEGHEFALIVVLEVEREIARMLSFEGLPGSRSPRWNASGDSLYFVPFLLDADDSERGLYEYRVKERSIARVLPDLFVSKEIAIADDILYGVSVVEPGPRLFASSLSELHG